MQRRAKHDGGASDETPRERASASHDPARHDPAASGRPSVPLSNHAVSRLLSDAPERAGEAQTPPGIVEGIRGSRGRGRPLPPAVRAGLGPPDVLPGVRLHRGPTADALATALGASAFTAGTDVYLRSGTPPLASPPGRTLLAHELTHVCQQRHGGDPRRLAAPDAPAEREARSAAAAARDGAPLPRPVRRTTAVARSPEDEVAGGSGTAVSVGGQTYSWTIPRRPGGVVEGKLKFQSGGLAGARTDDGPQVSVLQTTIANPEVHRGAVTDRLEASFQVRLAQVSSEAGSVPGFPGLTYRFKAGAFGAAWDSLKDEASVDLLQLGFEVNGDIPEVLSWLGGDPADLAGWQATLSVEVTLSLGPQDLAALRNMWRAQHDVVRHAHEAGDARTRARTHEREARRLRREQARPRRVERRPGETRRAARQRAMRQAADLRRQADAAQAAAQQARAESRQARAAMRSAQDRLASARRGLSAGPGALAGRAAGRGAARFLARSLARLLPVVGWVMTAVDVVRLGVLIASGARCSLGGGGRDDDGDREGGEGGVAEAEGEGGAGGAGGEPEGSAATPGPGGPEPEGGPAPEPGATGERGTPDGATAVEGVEGVELAPATRAVLEVLRADHGVELGPEQLRRLNAELPAGLTVEQAAAALAGLAIDDTATEADEVVRRVLWHVRSHRAKTGPGGVADAEAADGEIEVGEVAEGEGESAGAGAQGGAAAEDPDTRLLADPIAALFWDADESVVYVPDELRERLGEVVGQRGDGVRFRLADIVITNQQRYEIDGDPRIFLAVTTTARALADAPQGTGVTAGDELTQTDHLTYDIANNMISLIGPAERVNEAVHAAVEVHAGELRVRPGVTTLPLGVADVQVVGLEADDAIVAQEQVGHGGELVVTTTAVHDPAAVFYTADGAPVRFVVGERTRIPFMLVEERPTAAAR